MRIGEYTGAVRKHMIYTRVFSVESQEADKRILLHFAEWTRLV